MGARLNRRTPKRDAVPCAPWRVLDNVFAYTFYIESIVIDSEKALNVASVKEEIKTPRTQKTCSAMHSILPS